jgi:hypothetical protein
MRRNDNKAQSNQVQSMEEVRCKAEVFAKPYWKLLVRLQKDMSNWRPPRFQKELICHINKPHDDSERLG